MAFTTPYTPGNLSFEKAFEGAAMTRNRHGWSVSTQVNTFIHGHTPRGTGPRASVSTPMHAHRLVSDHTYTQNVPSHAQVAKSLALFGYLV